MLNCKQATQLLSERLDRPLDGKEKISLSLHTAICPACRKFGKQVEEISYFSKSYLKQKPKEK